ncbi:MAG: hypothetical protein ABWX84_15510 [Nocardioides sp.]
MSEQAVEMLELTTRALVELACRAPSVHNTQPWSWRIGPDRIDLYADWSRQLPVSDPQGRNLMISCGAALHHAQVVAAASGLDAQVTRFPDPSSTLHLATVVLVPAAVPLPDAADDLRALELRTTDRQRFTDWPIPDDRLRKVAASVAQDGVHGIALTDAGDRFRVELLVGAALTAQADDADLVAEQDLWLDHSNRDGIPSRAVPDADGTPHNQRSRFSLGSLLPDPADEIRPHVQIGSDGLIVIGTDADDRHAWLRAGEALSQLWLHATTETLAVVPLSQVVEVEETRRSLRHEVLGGAVHPQILVRMGWQELGQSRRQTTPRRPVDDVLLP